VTELINTITHSRYFTHIKNLFWLLRIPHWVKSLFVLIGFIYTPTPGYLLPALLAAFAFCLISSAVYIYNDIEDQQEDKLHPLKQHRPIVSGQVSVGEAVLVLFFLLIGGLILGWMVSKKLAFILGLYLAINVAYNHFFKVIPVLDVLSIALGFMLRALAGTVGIGLPTSAWLILAITLLSFFIALNKRKLEIRFNLKTHTRQVLKKYHPHLLSNLILGIGISTFLTYLMYVIFAHGQSFYFMLTLPFTAIALWRFALLAKKEIDNDDPILLFLRDRLSRFNLWCFIILTLLAVR